MNDLFDKMVQERLLDADAAQQARDAAAAGTPLDDALRSADHLSEEQLLRFLAQEFAVPYVDLEREGTPTQEFLAHFPPRLLVDHHLLPLRQQDDGPLVVATSRLFDTTGIDQLRMACGRDIRLVLTPLSEIDRCIKHVLGVGADTLQSLAAEPETVQVLDEESDELDLSAAAQDASIIKFVNQLLAEAIELRATDVHVEPFEAELRVRYRVDGVLQEANIPPQVRRFHAAIISRLKILSHLDIAEKRLPQDGRIKLRVAGREIDLRVSVIPMLHGEAMVLRILDRGDAMLGLEHLGMSRRDRSHFDRILEMPHGIVLVTGPTGSGKTTTLYAALSAINDIERKIITIEDPVEYHLGGINQIQVNTKAGLTFATGLRAILRHDPDVVLIGEIRDRETAEIAVQASLTGHLVFSTLHTNDAPGAATRLIDMGIEPYLVSSSVEAVVAQRLVRLICTQCKQTMPARELAALREELGARVPDVLYRGAGCRNCLGTGYKGRTGIFEFMPVTEEIRTLINERAPAGDIRRVAMRQGMNSLRGDGWRLVMEGRTTVEEVMRASKDESEPIGGAGAVAATAPIRASGAAAAPAAPATATSVPAATAAS